MSLVTAPGAKRRATVAAYAPARVDRSLLRRLWRHGGARAGVILGAILLVLTVFGPWLTPQQPNWPDYGAALEGPSAQHWLGTDATGRDLASRLIDGTHRTLGSSILVLSAIVAIGLVVGIAAGMIGGIVDTLLMRLVDVVMTLPGLVLAYAVIGLIGPGPVQLLVALVIADWAYFARLARSYSLSARDAPHVVAARLAGIGWARILFTHVLPGVAVPLAVVATIELGGVVGVLSAFSFLGLGVQPPYAEWGAMLAESRFTFTIAPWLLLGPAGMIVASVMAANLIGTGIRDVLDPKARR